MTAIEKLTKTLDMAAARQAEVTTSAMRIRGMSNIDSIIPAFGPCWIQFADSKIIHLEEKDATEYTVSAEQFSDYIAAKREFAARA